MWLDFDRLYTYNAMIYMLFGARGSGKTFGAKWKAVKNFVKKGEEFIYLRRYDTELSLVKENLFADLMIEKYPSDEMIEKGGTYYFNEKPCGYAMALSRSNYYKSASFPKVTMIIFDEFVIDTAQNLHYLKNEVRKFLDLIETVARTRENVKVFMLANSLSAINPYTLYWDIKISPARPQIRVVDGLVYCELLKDEEFIAFKKSTAFGKLNAGTEYERMAVDNEFILDDDTFIEKKPGNARHFYTLKHEGETMGVWWNPATMVYYISPDYDPACKLTYTVKVKDHDSKSLLTTRSDRGMFGITIKAFKQGMMRFENIRIKTIMFDLMKGVL